MKKRPKIRSLCYDWKEDGGEEWKANLKDFGLHVYNLPLCEGSDMFGYVVSDKPLTKKQIKDYQKRKYDI